MRNVVCIDELLQDDSHGFIVPCYRACHWQFSWIIVINAIMRACRWRRWGLHEQPLCFFLNWQLTLSSSRAYFNLVVAWAINSCNQSSDSSHWHIASVTDWWDDSSLLSLKCVSKVLGHLSKPAAPTSVPGLLRQTLLMSVSRWQQNHFKERPFYSTL